MYVVHFSDVFAKLELVECKFLSFAIDSKLLWVVSGIYWSTGLNVMCKCLTG